MRAPKAQLSLDCIPLFFDVSADELAEISAACSWQVFNRGQEIVGYLDDTRDVHFVVSGTAKVLIYAASGKVVGFRDLVRGDMFGEYAAIDKASRSASIEAQSECRVATMPSEKFMAVLAEQPSVSRALIIHLTKQLRNLTQRVLEFSTLAVDNRIQAELLRLAKEAITHNGATPTAITITPTPTHTEIAARISTHREAVARQMSRLSRLGVIERRGRSVVVKDLMRLSRMVEEATRE